MSQNRYPTSVPTAEAGVVLNFFRGQGSKEDALEAGWWVQGYAQNILIGSGQPLIPTMGAGPEMAAEEYREACMAGLEDLSQGDSGVKAKGQYIMALAKFLLPLLLKLAV